MIKGTSLSLMKCIVHSQRKFQARNQFFKYKNLVIDSLLPLIIGVNMITSYSPTFSLYIYRFYELTICHVRNMGLVSSFMGKGLATTQMLSFAIGTLYDRFMEKDVNNFEEFHMAILDIFNTFNASLPGKHYDAPTRKEMEVCFINWKVAEESEKKRVFIEFMKQKVKMSKLDDATLLTGLVTPPAAMAVKKAGESVPQLNMIKVIPDVLFVPSATILALVSVKLSRRIFMRNLSS